MLDRIYLDNNETSVYPLCESGTSYPNGLISDIEIMVPSDVSDVYVYSVVCTNTYVSAILTGTRNGKEESLGHSLWDKSGMAVSSIISKDTGKGMGWISFGSISGVPGSYIGSAKIIDSCVTRQSDNDSVCSFNGKTYRTPEVLNISVSGDIDYIDNKITVVVDNFLNSLDADDPEGNGGITSINGTDIQNSNTVSLVLPTNQDNKVVFSTSSIEKDITVNDPHKITVVSISNAYDDEKEYEPFTCPDTDPLLDTIIVHKHEVAYHETPLDSFIVWYRDNKYELVKYIGDENV